MAGIQACLLGRRCAGFVHQHSHFRQVLPAQPWSLTSNAWWLRRWEGNNGPRNTDYVGTTNLIAAAPKSIKRFVLVTSAGVERQKELPWAILNTFGEGWDRQC